MENTMEKTMVAANTIPAETVPAGLSERQIYNRLLKIADIENHIKLLSAKRDEIRAEILSGSECMYIDAARFTLDAGREPYKTFDSKRFKKDYPDLSAEYTRESTRAKFRVKFK